MEVNGTLVWYYFICKREVWLMSRNIAPDQNDTNIDIGRFLHETSFSRKKKEISFGNVKFDILMKDGNRVVIGETKKSSKFETSSKYQLLYYLKVLKKAGVEASGILFFPEEKKRINVELTDDDRCSLETVEKEIEHIICSDKAPKVEDNKYCRTCGYREYCYA